MDVIDFSLYSAYSTATYADWKQTQQIARHPERFKEANAPIGDNPSTGKVNQYFARKIALEVGISVILPITFSRIFLGGMSIYEFQAVKHNHSIGIKFNF